MEKDALVSWILKVVTDLEADKKSKLMKTIEFWKP